MKPLARLVFLAAACSASLVARGQNTVFNDSLTSDALNPAVYPAVTPASTGWAVLSNKNSPAPTETGGVLTINMASTTSGFIETQGLFAPAPVQVLPGTYLELTTTFVPTFIVTHSSDNLIVGFFNSGGSAPLTGLLTSGLSSSLSTFANGGAKGWVGYNANIPIGNSPSMKTRPAQTGTNNTVQDVLVDGQSSSTGYTTPAGANASSIGPMTATFTNGSTYTLDYKLSLSADGLTLTAAVSLYNGEGTSGTGSNTLIGSYTGRFSGSTLLTKSFDALALGWRADEGQPSNMKISALSVKTTGGAPWFTAQPPPSVLVSIGSDLSLTATVGGIVNGYQWQVSTDDGANYSDLDAVANPSAATPSLTITNVQNSAAGLYRLVATNAAGSTASDACNVSVSATPVAPSIVTQPASATVTADTPVTFSVLVNGTSPLTYQWQVSTDNVTFTDIAGANATAYTIASPTILDEGYYHVVVTNSVGTATSDPAQLTVNQPLTITDQPVGAALNLGDSYTLSVTALGKPAPTYQWYLNGEAIAGATDATYTISSAAAANAGIYTVVASNTAGDSVTSSGAAVAVLSPTLGTSALTPVSSATNVLRDARLTLTFNQPVSIGVMGTIKIFDASNPTIPVDTIDLVAATALMKSLRAQSTTSTQPLPVQNKTIGGVTNFNYYPITVEGNTATIYPRNNVLAYNKSYFVTIDPGVFTDSTGLAFAGISDNSGWAFATRTVGPASDATQITVAADGSGDFATVQGALDFIPSGNTTPRTILIRKGTYFEQVYFANKHSITLLGEDRAQTLIVYPNNNTFNNVSGVYHRMVFNADHANNVAIVNLSITNSTPKGGSQAEALILNGTTSSRAIISNVTLLSFQDTLQINGQAYVTDARISGDVDFMWGNGPCFFNNCDIVQLTSGGYFTQIRNGSGNHGYVFSNCRFSAPAGVTGAYFGRIDPAAFPFSEVVVLDSTVGDAANNTFLNTTTGVSGSNYKAGWWLLNNAASASAAPNVHNWSNNLLDGNGDALANPNGDAFTNMPTDATTQANYRDVAFVLGNNFTPALSPLISATPTGQTIDAGAGFTLSVQAFGIPSLTYQWLLNGVAIPGANSASYHVASSGGADAGMYSVIVSNGTSSVTTTAVPLVVHGGPPVIALQPADTTGLLGTTATLNIWALGDGPISYQWFKDGAPITGATRQSLRLTNLQATDAGSYSVAATNAGGTTTSNGAMLSLAAPVVALPTQPIIPNALFDVTDYGAIGDGVTNNASALQAAINAARDAGGGTVELPPAADAYLTGPITLFSNIDFQIDAGATLRALPFGSYPNSFTSPSHFITVASGSSNIEFSGGGTVEGDGAAWWAAFDAGTISARPRLVQMTRETNMLFTGLTFQNSPNFNLAFSSPNTNVTIFGVTIFAPGDSPNTDGIDAAGSNFLIQNCNVSVGDDNVVAKPGSVFCTNITVANCAFGTGHGVSIGGQTNVGLDGMLVTDCTFDGTSSCLRMKADPTQGGPVQNVTYRNITMTNVTYPILFYSYYNQLGSPGATSGSSQITPARVLQWNASPPNSLASSTIPTWKNIVIENLTATNASGYSTIWGLPLADALVANVTLRNVNISGGAGLEIYDATGVQITGSSNVGPYVTANSLAIVGQPQNATTTAGDNVSFTVTAVGKSGVNDTSPTFQWNLDGTPLVDGAQADGSTVSGATTATLSINNARVTGAGDYTCTVSNTLDGFDVATSTLVPNSLPVSTTSDAATLTVNPASATISVSDATFTYDGSPKSVTATTNPAGLATQITYDGDTDAPTNAGTYAVVATITDPNYVAAPANATLTIDPAPASVTLSNLEYVYDGTPKNATATTAPSGLATQITYNGDTTAPTNAGNYAVVATITDPNYSASPASDTLVIHQATPVLSWPAPAAITYGTPLSSTQLNATANTPGTFLYAPAAGTVLNAGPNQTLGVLFTPADAVNFTIASASRMITVNKASATITLAGLAQPYDGTPRVVTATTDPSGLAVDITYDGSTTAPIYPGDHAVVATINDQNYAGTINDTLVVTITALVRHAPTLNGDVDGSLQVLLSEGATMNGGAAISGDLLVPGLPSVILNGHPTYGGTLDGPGATTPTNFHVTLNSAVLRHVVRRIDPITMPAVNAPPAPTGTRNVALNNANQSAGDFATLRNLTLNSSAGVRAIPPGTYGVFVANGNSGFVLGVAGSTTPAIYNLQGLTLNKGTSLQIVGPVILTLANGPVFNSGVVGNANAPEWLLLRVASGGVTLNSSATLHGFVVAPSGTITINGALDGEVICDRLTVNGNGVLSDPDL